MHLRVLLPSHIFVEVDAVTSIVAETPQGSFGLLPRRRDCVTALRAGILTYKTAAGEFFLAVDEGILVKSDDLVVVSVRHAIGGSDLGSLRAAVDQEFLQISDQQKSVRSVLARLESGFIHRFAELQRS